VAAATITRIQKNKAVSKLIKDIAKNNNLIVTLNFVTIMLLQLVIKEALNLMMVARNLSDI